MLPTNVAAHSDDASTILHPARFFRGPLRSAGDIFVEAANIFSNLDHDPSMPISSYDTSDLGLGFAIPPVLWKRLHNIMCDEFSILDVAALRNSSDKKKMVRADVSVELFCWSLGVFCILSHTIRWGYIFPGYYLSIVMDIISKFYPRYWFTLLALFT